MGDREGRMVQLVMIMIMIMLIIISPCTIISFLASSS